MELEAIKNSVETNSIQVQQMVNNILTDQANELDTYISNVRNLFLGNVDIPDGDLDRIILAIPVYIYSLTQVLQEIEIRKGVSSESAKYDENEALLQATGTVAEKQARATNATINSRIVQLAYKTASSKLQAKINGAMEILSSAKKVQQRRLEEMKLTKAAGNSVGAF